MMLRSAVSIFAASILTFGAPAATEPADDASPDSTTTEEPDSQPTEESNPGPYNTKASDADNNYFVEYHGSRPAARVPGRPGPPPERYARATAAICALSEGDTLIDIIEQMGGCTDGRVESIIRAPCDEGTYELHALWVQRLQPDGTYGPAEKLTDEQCVAPADLAGEAEHAFTSMHVPAPTATLQSGNRTKLLVNAWYPVYASDDVITQTATLLDVPVEIRAFPAQYTWDFDDPFSPEGGTLTTSNPGRPWVDGDPAPDERWIAHAWTRLGDPDTRAGKAAHTTIENGIKARTDVHVTLETTWHGQFRIVGTTQWTEIPGELTTTSDAGTYMVTEARSRLVCDDLNGNTGCTL